MTETTDTITHQVQAAEPPFILYMDGQEYVHEMSNLAIWVSDLLLPVYGREVSSSHPWCPRWWEHLEAIARLHALWLAWQECTDVTAGASGPSVWHRDHLGPAMAELRSPTGPFAGCKEGSHRAKSIPLVEAYIPPNTADGTIDEASLW
jgi:hypothetical protein